MDAVVDVFKMRPGAVTSPETDGFWPAHPDRMRDNSGGEAHPKRPGPPQGVGMGVRSGSGRKSHDRARTLAAEERESDAATPPDWPGAFNWYPGNPGQPQEGKLNAKYDIEDIWPKHNAKVRKVNIWYRGRGRSVVVIARRLHGNPVAGTGNDRKPSDRATGV